MKDQEELGGFIEDHNGMILHILGPAIDSIPNEAEVFVMLVEYYEPEMMSVTAIIKGDSTSVIQ